MNKITFIVQLDDDGNEARIKVQSPEGAIEENYIDSWKFMLSGLYHVDVDDVFTQSEWDGRNKPKEMTRNDVKSALMEGSANNPDAIKEYLREGFVGYDNKGNATLEAEYRMMFNKKIKITNQ